MIRLLSMLTVTVFSMLTAVLLITAIIVRLV